VAPIFFHRQLMGTLETNDVSEKDRNSLSFMDIGQSMTNLAGHVMMVFHLLIDLIMMYLLT